MHDEQRSGIRASTRDVDEVNGDTPDPRHELGQRVQRGFVPPPVVAVAPVVDERSQIGQARAESPLEAMNLVGPSYPRQALAQVGEDGGVYRVENGATAAMDLW